MMKTHQAVQYTERKRITESKNTIHPKAVNNQKHWSHISRHLKLAYWTYNKLFMYKSTTNSNVYPSITSYRQNTLQHPPSCPSPQIPDTITSLFKHCCTQHLKMSKSGMTLPLSCPALPYFLLRTTGDNNLSLIYSSPPKSYYCNCISNVHLQKGIDVESTDVTNTQKEEQWYAMCSKVACKYNEHWTLRRKNSA